MLQGTSLWGSRFGVQLRLFSNISQVAKEAAAAAVLLPSLRPSHCATCLVQLPDQHPCLLPCLRCPAVFCGKLCREQTGHALLCRMEHTMDEVLEQVRVNQSIFKPAPFFPFLLQIAGSPCQYFPLALALLAKAPLTELLRSQQASGLDSGLMMEK